MKPAKEKAKELVREYWDLGGMDIEQAKEFALVGFNELLRCAIFATDEIYNYYLEVKIEIEKL
jgi:hypothetical protein